MSNEEIYFSASEINKFTYCNYSWYYERKKYVVEYSKKNKNSATRKNFRRGIKFHKNYYVRNKRLRLLKLFIIIGLVLIFMYFITKLIWII